jgi:hypothetical protein
MKIHIGAAVLLAAINASADDRGITPPPDLPAYYKDECGSCHVPYPPNLLPAGGFTSGGWRPIMRDLRNHYGDDATLDEATRQKIEQYLVQNAAHSDRRVRTRSEPPRVTTTLWFHRNHGTVKSSFGDPAVGGAANCNACHPRAEQWNYAKADIVSPQARGKDRSAAR